MRLCPGWNGNRKCTAFQTSNETRDCDSCVFRTFICSYQFRHLAECRGNLNAIPTPYYQVLSKLYGQILELGEIPQDPSISNPAM